MSNRERALNALRATRALGIPDEEVMPLLKRLYLLYNKNWGFIEEANYRVLIDAYFGETEGAMNGKESSIKTSKKPRLQEEEGEKILPLDKGIIDLDSPTNSPEQEVRASSNDRSSSQSYEKPGVGNGAQLQRREIGPSLNKRNWPNFREEKLAQPPSQLGCVQNGVSGVERHSVLKLEDITKGSERVKIPLTSEVGKEGLPKFTYIPHSIAYQNAHVSFSLARIADDGCCLNCSGNCLSSIPCACASETGGEFAYTKEGLLKEEFLSAVLSMKQNPQKHHFVYCQDCPLERSKNEYRPEKCKGHMVRKFIKECWRKCGCDMSCGNRVVQGGIKIKLEVFLTPDGKGWGVRTLENLRKGTFVCEYIGEILTNAELYERNLQNLGGDRHTYPVLLDADWGSENILKDEEALCLDATFIGNVARFINHRCGDPNLTDVPVEIETPDHHYYHIAFFTTRDIRAFEELTWDYGIDFDDHEHPIKAFQCCCGSQFCRYAKKKGTRYSSRRRGLSH